VYTAAQEGHVQIIRTLCKLGADINVRDKVDRTPVFMAASKGDQKMVKLLRKLGADMNDKSIVGMTPLDAARLQRHAAVADKLMRYTACFACCQKQATATVKLSACSRCLKTYYCSAAYQKHDWKKHKQTCAAAAAADQA
jgi:hypothetical protein